MGIPVNGRWVWRDGALMPWQEATVSAFAHSMQRGSLVFDVLSFHATPRGAAVFRMPEHVARLLRSASLIGMAVPYPDHVIEAATRETVRESGLSEGLIRISGFFPEMEPDLVPLSAEGSVTIIAYAPRELVPPGAPPKGTRLHLGIERELQKPGRA